MNPLLIILAVPEIQVLTLHSSPRGHREPMLGTNVCEARVGPQTTDRQVSLDHTEEESRKSVVPAVSSRLASSVNP